MTRQLESIRPSLWTEVPIRIVVQIVVHPVEPSHVLMHFTGENSFTYSGRAVQCGIGWVGEDNSELFSIGVW